MKFKNHTFIHLVLLLIIAIYTATNPIAGQQQVAVKATPTLCLEVEEVYPKIEGDFSINLEEKVKQFLTDMELQVVPSDETCEASLTVLFTGKAWKPVYGDDVKCYGAVNYKVEMTYRVSATDRADKSKSISGFSFRWMPIEECSKDKKKAPYDLAWQTPFLKALEKFWSEYKIYLAALESSEDWRLQFTGFRFFRLNPIIPEAVPGIARLLETAVKREGQIANTAREDAYVFMDRYILTTGFDILTYLGPRAAEAVPSLCECLQYGSVITSRETAGVLSSIGPAAMEAVPFLINSLREALASDEHDERDEIYVKALKNITRQDFGNDADRWSQWWEGQKGVTPE